MKGLNIYVALFAFSMGLPLAAQNAEYQAYFEDCLKGKETVCPQNKKIKTKNIETLRSEVWKSWTAANRNFNEEKLIDLAPICSSTVGHWNLPANLEPNAVMPYYYGSKGEKPSAGYPLFLYIHGSGPKEAEWSTGLKLAQYFEDGPSIYFVPQIPNEGEYYRWYQKSKQYAWNKLLRQALLQDYINPSRLYILGISEGGYGSQRMASFYADYWAAAGPMAGGEPLKNAPVENCGNIGFSFLTGALDKGFYRDILTTYTKQAFDSLEIMHPGAYKHRIELIPGRAHHIDYSPTTPWLKQFERNAWPKEFSWEDYEMDGVHRTGFYNLAVQERPDAELRTRYDVKIEDNVVDVTVRNVHYTTIEKDQRWGIEMKFTRKYTMAEKGKFVVYLNEHLVDLDKKVKVIVNGKTVFKGKLKCSSDDMLKSTVEFFDPLRIYPASVQVEL